MILFGVVFFVVGANLGWRSCKLDLMKKAHSFLSGILNKKISDDYMEGANDTLNSIFKL